MIISTGAGKAFDKNLNPFLRKILSRPKIQGNFLNMKKGTTES